MSWILLTAIPMLSSSSLFLCVCQCLTSCYMIYILTDLSDASDSPEELLELKSKKHSTVRIARHTVQAQAGEKDTALSQLQQEIVLFLAGLDMSTCLALANVDDSSMTEEAVSWTSVKLLRFYLPFSDMKTCIYLGKFIPRFCFNNVLYVCYLDREIPTTSDTVSSELQWSPHSRDVLWTAARLGVIPTGHRYAENVVRLVTHVLWLQESRSLKWDQNARS